MELLYFWIGVMIFFLILEMFTATFYGLSLAIASAITGVYVWYMKLSEIDLYQALIFALISLLTSYFLPRILTPESAHAEVPQGVDKYLSQKRKVKKVGDSYKISLDGVDYLVESDDDITTGNQVEVVSSHGAGFVVKKVQK